MCAEHVVTRPRGPPGGERMAMGEAAARAPERGTIRAARGAPGVSDVVGADADGASGAGRDPAVRAEATRVERDAGACGGARRARGPAAARGVRVQSREPPRRATRPLL